MKYKDFEGKNQIANVDMNTCHRAIMAKDVRSSPKGAGKRNLFD
jgi:hypothetical protein